MHALTALNSRKASAERNDIFADQGIRSSTLNPSASKNAEMLRSERFRTTVKDPPFAYEYMEPGDIGTKSMQQLEQEEFRQIIRQQNMRKHKSVMRMSKGDPTPLMDHNRRRSYNEREEMQRWVGSTIADSFKGPEVDKVQVKLSKKFLKMAQPKQNTYKVPSTMNNFMHQPAERCQWQTHKRHNDENRFIWVDGNRKVGRQLIPKQYVERETMLRSSMPDVASKKQGSAISDYGDGPA